MQIGNALSTTTGVDHIVMGEGLKRYVNYRLPDTPDNAPTIYIILCAFAGNNDVNGTIKMDRTSGLRFATSIDVLISAGSSATPVGGLRAISTSGTDGANCELVKVTYDPGTGTASEHIAVKVFNPDNYYETSGVYFTGRSSVIGVMKPVEPSEVSSVSIFELNTKFNWQGSLKFNDFNSASVTSNGSLPPVQTNYAPTQNTLAILAVDPVGNVVRGSQEGTWTFTKAQLDALGTTAATGSTLILTPGADYAVVIEESNWMIKYSGTGSMSDNSFIVTQQNNVASTAEITRLPSGQINNIMSSAPANPSYGFYSRDLPLYNLDGRTYRTNTSTKFHRFSGNPLPTNLTSISIKLKYRVFDVDTF